MKKWGIAFILSALIPIYLAFDKILRYSNKYNTFGDRVYDWSENVNAYVGGDAYNLIINSNYFIGYLVLALILVLIGSTILICNYLSSNNLDISIIKDKVKTLDDRTYDMTKSVETK